MAGTQVSGIDVGEVYKQEWATPLSAIRKYNKEAFIVISNNSHERFD